jgi:hypothetical protein
MKSDERGRTRQNAGKLDEFSQWLDARTREFKERGELSDLHQSLLRQIQGRHDRMQANLASVEAKGSTRTSSESNSSGSSAHFIMICFCAIESKPTGVKISS